tara:strand:+ start:3254 stop:4585 length:1332 start_codon:yes stop_codon:yes gene_type:complete
MPHTPLHRTNIPLFQRRERIPGTNYFLNNQPPNYDPNIGGPRKYDFFSSKLGEGLLGAASDIAEGVGYLGEGLKTGYNYGQYATDKFINKPAAYLLQDPYGIMPGSLRSVEEIDKDMSNYDITFDKPRPGGALGPDFAEFSNIRAMADSDLAESVINNTQNFMADLKEEYPSSGGNAYAKVLDPKSDINTFSKGSDQPTITEMVKETNDPDLIQKSDDLSKQTVQKDNIDTTNKEEKKGWLSGLQTGINNFVDRLDEPGFQTALAMHMEAKGGGDITDVLFAGVKMSNKAKSAAFTSHMNELKLQEMQLNIASKGKKLATPTQATDSMKGIVKSLLAQYELKRPGLLEGATATISSRAMEYVDAGMSEIDAAQKAMQDASGALEPNKWFDQFIGKGGGEFDIMKMAPAGGSQVQYYSDAAGRTVIFDGTSYRYADGTPYTPGE